LAIVIIRAGAEPFQPLGQLTEAGQDDGWRLVPGLAQPLDNGHPVSIWNPAVENQGIVVVGDVDVLDLGDGLDVGDGTPIGLEPIDQKAGLGTGILKYQQAHRRVSTLERSVMDDIIPHWAASVQSPGLIDQR
jgi:hypothetical protein